MASIQAGFAFLVLFTMAPCGYLEGDVDGIP